MTLNVPPDARREPMDLPGKVSPEQVRIERVPTGLTALGVAPGDILLSRAHGLRHSVIKFGQGLRLAKTERTYRDYTHAALVVSATGDLIEAVGSGVRRSNLAEYVNEPYAIVHINASAEDRQQVVDVATALLEKKSRYSSLSTVSIALKAFIGWRFTFFMDGSYTCSGLVARAMLAIGAVFPEDAVKVTPAQLAIYFKAPLPPGRAPRRRRAAGSGARSAPGPVPPEEKVTP